MLYNSPQLSTNLVFKPREAQVPLQSMIQKAQSLGTQSARWVSLLVLLLSLSVSTFGQKILWQKAIGGTAYDQGMRMFLTPTNCVVLGGTSASNDKYAKGNHAAGTQDIMVTKVSAAGHVIWTTMIGGTGNEELGEMIPTPDEGLILIGTTESNDGDVVGNHGKMDIFVAKLDKMGKIEWTKCYGGSGNDKGFAICTLPDGGYMIGGEGGSRNGDVTRAIGGLDSFVAEIDAKGNIVRQKNFGSTGNERVCQMLYIPNIGVLTVNTTTAGGGDVKTYMGGSDVWIFVLSKNWDFVWQRSFGGSDFDEPHKVILDKDNRIVIAGTTFSDDEDNENTQFRGLGDAWLLCLNTDGMVKFSQCYGGSKSDGANAVSQTPDGGFIMVGMTTSMDRFVPVNKGLYDGYIVRTDADGKMIWSGTFGGEDFEYLYDVIPLPNGNYFALGFAESVKGDLSRIEKKDYGNDFWFFKFTDPDDPKDHPFASNAYLIGRTTVKGTGAPIRAEITLTNNDSLSVSKKVFADPTTGIFQIPLPMKGKYSVMVTAPGFMFYGQDLDFTQLSENPEIRLDVQLDPIDIGSKVILSNIFFETGEWKIKDESAPELARLKYFLDLNKDIKVEISGHTDNTGSGTSKEELSLRRAESVRDFMLKAGIVGKCMQVAGYGMSRPVGDNATEVGRAANRRVEVEVVEIFRR